MGSLLMYHRTLFGFPWFRISFPGYVWTCTHTRVLFSSNLRPSATAAIRHGQRGRVPHTHDGPFERCSRVHLHRYDLVVAVRTNIYRNPRSFILHARRLLGDYKLNDTTMRCACTAEVQSVQRVKYNANRDRNRPILHTFIRCCMRPTGRPAGRERVGCWGSWRKGLSRRSTSLSLL